MAGLKSLVAGVTEKVLAELAGRYPQMKDAVDLFGTEANAVDQLVRKITANSLKGSAWAGTNMDLQSKKSKDKDLLPLKAKKPEPYNIPTILENGLSGNGEKVCTCCSSNMILHCQPYGIVSLLHLIYKSFYRLPPG